MHWGPKAKMLIMQRKWRTNNMKICEYSFPGRCLSAFVAHCRYLRFARTRVSSYSGGRRLNEDMNRVTDGNVQESRDFWSLHVLTFVLQHGFLLGLQLIRPGPFRSSFLRIVSVCFRQFRSGGPALAADPRPRGHQRFGKSDN